MKSLTLALRLLQRDWRSNELRLLAIALLVAVTAVTAVDFFTARVDAALALQATELLAADLVLEGSVRPSDELVGEAQRRGLSTALTLTFPSVILYRDTTVLVQVKAVSAGYPLRGRLRTATQPSGKETAATGLPAPGTAWAERRLFALLNSESNTLVSLGDKNLILTRVLTHEPDRGWNLFRLAPRVLISMDDLAATGLVTPASRVSYRLLLAGDAGTVAGYRQWIKDRRPSGMSLMDIGSARPEMRSALQRGGSFLSLAAIVSVLLAGAAIALSANRYVERQADASAILRCLGATRAQVLNIFVLRLAGLGLTTSLMGCLLGFLAQYVLAQLVGHWFGRGLPAPSPSPIFTGLVTGGITLIGFALPPLLRLGNVSPLRVLRRDLRPRSTSSLLVLGTATLAICALILWRANDVNLAAWVLGGTAVTLVVLAAASRLLVYLLSPARRQLGSVWRYGLANLARSPGTTLIQLVGFGIGILAILLLTLIRVDLISAWQRQLPPQAPNFFLINIQADEVDAMLEFLTDAGIQTGGIFPMLRGRLTHIDDRLLTVSDYANVRAKRLLRRDYNLSWTRQLPSDNRVTWGHWWGMHDQGQGLFSVEREWAKTMGVDPGDTLSFNIAGQTVTGRVSNLRSVKWDSFNPNFFVIGTPALLQEHPTTYITSFFLHSDRFGVTGDVVKRFPSVTVIDVNSILSNIRRLMDQGARAVEYVFLFTLFSGLVVLFAAIQATRENRVRESVILRTLGLTRRQILQAIGSEFLLLGMLAGLLGSAAAALVGYILTEQIFLLDYEFNPWVAGLGVIGSVLGISIAGVLATYPLVTKPPLEVLRQA